MINAARFKCADSKDGVAMKRVSNELREDVSELVEKVTVEEARNSVLDKLESAFKTLDPKSQEVLQAYFNGVTLKELSQQNAISINQAQDWIRQIKRQLITQLQRNNSVRH
ncbi:MAG: sigma-70 family RNA polymerase sigma factor [Proteobacteria bacterium]|nr:sigma-70 family RNA polymerase sigma factor [Pseudomonadota bacterium]